ncbi:MAG: restriction endonuclease, partial [Prevotella sp.]|nr:restriction endonuclease [Prevotella sp.]
MAYTNEQLRNLFQNKFNLQDWTQFLITYFGAQTIRQRPELLDIVPSEGEGYYLGKKQTTDNYEIGLFYLKLNSSVKKRRVGLRQLIKPYLRYLVDAALVVFDDGKNWRLSFICDLKGDNTSPKRYTFVFGEPGNFYNTAVSRFLKLQQEGITFLSIKDAFSVEALTKEFYNELFGWYQWAVSEESGIYFPNDTNTAADDFEDIDKKIIRLLTRLMFVWFIKQKGLVPNNLFEESYLKKILKDFNPQSQQQGVYYNAILQNLFFATLNRAIEDEDGKRGFAKREGQRDVKTLYRYAELFKISEEEVLNVFADIPFLNGGLFECLDKTKKIDGVEKA